MSFQRNYLVLWACLFAIYVAVGGVLIFLWKPGEATHAEEIPEASEARLQRVIDHMSESVHRMVDEYSWWNDMAAFVADPETAWANSMVDYPAENMFQVNHLWICDADGVVVHEFHAGGHPDFANPLALDVIREADTAQAPIRIYSQVRGGAALLEIWVSPIVREDQLRGQDAPAGYLLGARNWTPEYLDRMGLLYGRLIRWMPAQDPVLQEEREVFSLLLPLRGSDGALSALAGVVASPSEIRNLNSRLWISALLLVLFLVTVSILLIQQQGYLKPVQDLLSAVGSQDRAKVAGMAGHDGELGRISDLLLQFLDQKQRLEDEVSERRAKEAALERSEDELRRALDLRERLARDLHDNIMQSIYATGLQIEQAFSELPKGAESEAASNRMTQIKNNLNEILRDLRDFLAGLEPATLRKGGLRNALEKMVESYRATTACRFSTDIENEAIACLNDTGARHVFFVSKELISNAIRHADPGNIRVNLRLWSNDVILEVQNDGQPLPEKEARHRGRGLTNIAERAAEAGGRFSIINDGDKATLARFYLPAE